MTTASAWAPLRLRVFRMLWIAVLAGNVGAWMQTVGAQWRSTADDEHAEERAVALAEGPAEVSHLLPADSRH